MERMSPLKDYLEKHPDIVFAYLFGGLTKKPPGPYSDVDIAIYVKEPKRIKYLDIFTDITRVLGTDEVGLVVLNKAPLSLSGRVLLSKKLLVDKEPFLRHRYESLTLRKFFDFQVKERQIFKRRYGIG